MSVGKFCTIKLDGSKGFKEHAVNYVPTTHPLFLGKTVIVVNGQCGGVHVLSDSGVPGLKIKVDK